MNHIQTKVLSATLDVDRRLKEMGLDRERLRRVVAGAFGERANATPYHCANAPGTLAYQYGVFKLRDQFVSLGWQIDRDNGVEAIRDDVSKVKISFANVDAACGPVAPKPRSEKGSGSERAAQGNLFGSLPEFASAPSDGYALYYVMVDDEGNAELTRPVIQGGTFTAAIERIFLGSVEDDPLSGMSADSNPPDEAFDPIVVRK